MIGQSEARARLAEGRHFAAGSMGPKIEAVIGYLERGGVEAIVTDPGNVERALAGETGTHIGTRRRNAPLERRGAGSSRPLGLGHRLSDQRFEPMRRRSTTACSRHPESGASASAGFHP
jgi:hypothetical protein